MTVVKLSDDVVAETVLIAAPAAPMPDGVVVFEDPAALNTKGSSRARSCSGLTTATFVGGVAMEGWIECKPEGAR